MFNKGAKILFGFIILLQITACDRRSCQNVVCSTSQQCYNGLCYCVDGYEGTDCATASYQKYVGNYSVSETCNGASPNFFNYECSIYPDPNYINRVYINDLFGQGVQATMFIHTDQNNQGNSVEVPLQQQGSLSYSGQGTYDSYNNRMVINFNYTYNGLSYGCTHTFYKHP